MNFRRLLIISDNIPNKCHGGVSHTLYNLFDQWPSDKLIIFSEDANEQITADHLHGEVLRINLQRIKQWPNRLGKWGFNNWITMANCWLIDLLPVHWPSRIKKPDLILVSATSVRKLQIAERLQTLLHIPLVPYFMDNWMHANTFTWGTSNLYQLVYRLLNRNRKWITISMALQHALEREYHLVPHKCLHVHNPVASGTELAPGKVVNEPFTIIYAGSVFDMHFDAILMTGKAIQALNRNYGRNAFELILFTTQSFWQSWQHAFKSADISYGGFVHPDALPVSLSKAELLLVASAYDERYRHMVEASIQTKLTEYMRTGVPILSVGPAYSACHAFLRDWHSGWVFEGTSVDALGAFIEQIKTDKATSDAYCTNALHVVATHFSKPVVQEKLYTFLAEVV